MPISIFTLVLTETQLTQSTFAQTGVTALGATTMELRTKGGMVVTKFKHRNSAQGARNKFRTHREGKIMNNLYIGECEWCGMATTLIPIVHGHNGFEPEYWDTGLCSPCYDNLAEQYQDLQQELESA